MTVQNKVSSLQKQLPHNLTFSSPHYIDEIVINFHITEACNYRCAYCYAHWSKKGTNELWRHPNGVEKLLYELARYFFSSDNDLRSVLQWKQVRLSFAGGEPTLIPHLGHYIERAKQLGFEVSLITNGSRLSPDFLVRHGKQISMLGLSIDSIRADTQKRIGRINRQQIGLSINDFQTIADKYRHENSAGKVKVNTVVSHENYREDLSELINRTQPDKWKVLKVLPFKGFRTLSDNSFQHFLATHQQFSDFMSVENNEDMTNSYLMINPHGHFFQNSDLDQGYDYFESTSIKDVGVEHALHEIAFDPLKFAKRYS
ncbi:viperin family antiviral radical SAM protein [Terasakiella sp.]|uniref:viperin family antiviral radical SAM protein n=1 Tax=Terasakiella sp. TaxID=2034861 RepID=UPI003AA81644